ncbi:MAG: hypothetical protein E3J22_07480 [Candidatus Aminicenantes bacterium]|nr:MAG: hypothetical protein E3J22_07480 [Candidatus Aminicenantes bacterium]
MRNFTLKTAVKFLFFAMIISLLCFQGESIGLIPGNAGIDQEQEVKKARLYKDVFPLITESDLYCSIFVMDKMELEAQIVGSERDKERILLRESEIFYVNRGIAYGFEVGQLYTILQVGEKISNPITGKRYGRIVYRRGRAQIVSVEEDRAFAKLEKSCGEVMVGHFLVPFEEKSGLLGKDLGYDVPISEEEGSWGRLVYFQDDYQQISKGHYSIVDIGEEDGIHFGQQLVIYRKTEGKMGSIEKIGNSIVIDTKQKTSTVKILSSNNALRVGDFVQPRYK